MKVIKIEKSRIITAELSEMIFDTQQKKRQT